MSSHYDNARSDWICDQCDKTTDSCDCVAELRPATAEEPGQWAVVDNRNGQTFVYDTLALAQQFKAMIEDGAKAT